MYLFQILGVFNKENKKLNDTFRFRNLKMVSHLKKFQGKKACKCNFAHKLEIRSLAVVTVFATFTKI